MARLKDIQGKTFNRLTVKEYAYTKNKLAYWACVCICGKEIIVSGASLRNGNTKSCGCLVTEKAKQNKQIDLIGKRFHRLIVIEPTERRVNRSVVWRCICDCGNETFVPRGSLIQGHTKSCGCWAEIVVQGSKPERARANAQSCYRILYSRYKTTAKSKSLEFNLTLESAISLFSANCVYCGDAPKQKQSAGKYASILYTGIDRKDNYKGYILDNCVSCCRTCNVAKGTMTHDEFIEWNRKVYANINRTSTA